MFHIKTCLLAIMGGNTNVMKAVVLQLTAFICLHDGSEPHVVKSAGNTCFGVMSQGSTNSFIGII